MVIELESDREEGKVVEPLVEEELQGLLVDLDGQTLDKRDVDVH
jgi:hypothetical protein